MTVDVHPDYMLLPERLAYLPTEKSFFFLLLIRFVMMCWVMAKFHHVDAVICPVICP